MHLVYGIINCKLVEMMISDENMHDSKCAIPWIDKAIKKAKVVCDKVKKVIYDARKIFRYLSDKGPVMKFRRGQE